MKPTIPIVNLDRLDAPLSISPTDVSQFIRLDQCRRYLRLRLHERARVGRHIAASDPRGSTLATWRI